MNRDKTFHDKKQRKIGSDLSRVVAVMLAVLGFAVVTLSVSLFSSLVTKMLEERCVSATNILAYELAQDGVSDDTNLMLDELKSRLGCELTIFEGNTRAYTTVVQNGRRVVGTKLSDAISAIVLQQGKSYVGEADILNEKYLCSYVPTTDASGQVNGLIFAGISKATASQQTLLVIVLSVGVSAAAIVVCAALLTIYLKRRVTVPLSEISRTAQRLERGDLGLASNEDIQVKVYANDEIGELGIIFEKTILRMRSYIGEISDILGAIADGDLTSQVRQEYVGDFVSIKQSLEGIEVTLSNTMRQIADSAGQVSSRASHVSTNAQTVARGASEQAGEVQQLAATIGEISRDAERTTQAAGEVGRSAEQASAQLGLSMEYVKHMNESMEQISRSSEEISKIISTIEGIAFQTNILALNAAVEAARAGSAGKGFAVVSDEVRNLATKSDEAAKATKVLIESAIAAVNDGSGAVSKVTESLEKTNEIASDMTTKMAVVVEAVEKQTTAITQVTLGIDRISDVVQTNSATSGKSAAASEELTSQAGMLMRLVDFFRLKR